MKASNENKQTTIDEVGLYEADASRNGEINPLEFWRENARRYSKLAQMARKYLAIPATPVPSERLFSRTGNIATKLRCSLLPENVNKLRFLSVMMAAETGIPVRHLFPGAFVFGPMHRCSENSYRDSPSLYTSSSEVASRCVPSGYECPTEDQRNVHMDLQSQKMAAAKIPFASIYLPSQPDVEKQYFIPGVPAVCKVTLFKRDIGSHFLNANLYEVALEHGPFSWKVWRRYKHFSSLHKELQLYKMGLAIPLPTRTHRATRRLAREVLTEMGGEHWKALPEFPAKPDYLVPQDQIEARTKELETYLNQVLAHGLYRNHEKMREFLEVSRYSFLDEVGSKGKEGELLKRQGERTRSNTSWYGGCVSCIAGCCNMWRKRWLIVKDTFIMYKTPGEDTIREVMLYDSGFQVLSATLSLGLPNSLIITNNNRRALDYALSLALDEQKLT
ncbi:unnamed protein product [Darwinula stevensoni]|uniref:PX domain-containing protein n=1 Tax=Darwinula stevensoni TaxID=69355 RepID=A0A7R9A6Y4_9CRUS|nr:unnamed protein product [Darwinula stevensoni]CAG0890746.1 unnamed protein product [Darwinula stevensoni]